MSTIKSNCNIYKDSSKCIWVKAARGGCTKCPYYKSKNDKNDKNVEI